MSALQEARKQIFKALKAAIGKGYSPSIDELETPTVSDLGDIAFPCFGMSKGLKRNPAELASEIAPKIKLPSLVAKVEAKGPYINFFLHVGRMGVKVCEEAVSEYYGSSDAGQGKKILIEFFQPNTHKEIHVGHLRTALIGQTVVNVEKNNGTEVVPVSYINDLGGHVAKCLWAIQKFHPDEEPEKEDRNAFLGKVYTEATVWLDEHPEDKEEVQKIFQSLEAGHRGWISLWKKTKKWSMDVIENVADELGLTIDQWYFESQLFERAGRIVDDLLDRKIAEISQGATIVDLEKEGLGVNLLRRTDGTLLYNAKDLALALKKEEQHNPDLSLYVIDVRQSLAMKQLFATLKRMGFKKQLEHLSYEIITLPNGAMSSRKGTIVKYETLRDDLIKASEAETRARHKDWKDKKIQSTARAIAFAALKFSILSHDLEKVIVFDPKKALSFDGFTGPYCLYALARMQSIFRKTGKSECDLVTSSHIFNHQSEAALIKKIAAFPDLLLQVGKSYQVSAIAQYAFDLAKQFNEFYHNCPVIQAENDSHRQSRLALCQATERTLKNSLALLGIDPINEM